MAGPAAALVSCPTVIPSDPLPPGAAGAGPPAAPGADPVEAAVFAVLDRLGEPYEVMRIDPAHADTAVFCQTYGVPREHSVNTIVVGSRREPRRFAACLVKATTRLDVNHAVRRLMGVARLSFAGAEETRALTGMLIGGVTPFALPPDLPIYVDEAVLALPWIILGGGSRACKVKVAPAALTRLPGVQVVPGLAG